jgi:hypothetical protein
MARDHDAHTPKPKSTTNAAGVPAVRALWLAFPFPPSFSLVVPSGAGVQTGVDLVNVGVTVWTRRGSWSPG